MKNKIQFFRILLLTVLSTVMLNGCKKSNDNDMSTGSDETAELRSNAEDELRVSNDVDDLMNEVNEVALTNKRFMGMNAMPFLSGNHIPCNAVIDSSLMSQGTIIITFNGNNCGGNRTRTGSITLQLPYDATSNTVTPWTTAGCVLTVTFSQYRITKMMNGKSITFNGSKQITNVNGGLVDDATSFITPIVHRITGMMQITFDNNTTRTWNIDRTRTIERTNNLTTIAITGNATANGISNVAMWGINRKGNSFTVSIPTPVVLNSACSFNAISGVRILQGLVRVLTVTYGVDQSGNVVSSGCPFGYRLNWINKQGNPVQVIIAY